MEIAMGLNFTKCPTSAHCVGATASVFHHKSVPQSLARCFQGVVSIQKKRRPTSRDLVASNFDCVHDTRADEYHLRAWRGEFDRLEWAFAIGKSHGERGDVAGSPRVSTTWKQAELKTTSLVCDKQNLCDITRFHF